MSELRRNRGPSTPPDPAQADPGTHAPAPSGRPPTVASTELLGSGGILGIEHNGELYTLRRTRNGRLILTK
jgi:hemin uptake protein HemP